MGDEMRGEVDINVAHRHHLTGTLEATLCLHIGKRSIPRQIDLASGERLYQGLVVRVDHPVQFDTMLKKMRLQSSKYTDVSGRCRPAKPHHHFLPNRSRRTADRASGAIAAADNGRMDRSAGMSILSALACNQRSALERRSHLPP